ncbi:MAG: fructosamine kinase family protein [Anaerolineales bacterium]|nr:fructosamine kinase family protein [Anaerolineales bacterium]
MKQVHPDVQVWINKNQLGNITSVDPVSGGCIHQALRVQTASGEYFILKQDPGKYEDVFQREAEGLEALKVSGGPVIPDVYLVGEEYLLLSDLQPAPRCKDFWQIYGQQLAVVHLQQNPRFGFETDNYIGSNPQENTWMENGWEFYRDLRIKNQIKWANDRSLLDTKDIHKLENFMVQLPVLIPEQPASLIHGDLWSGNLISDNGGKPALIDPAVYYGWAEADLAMTDLFGRYPEEFFKAYAEINPLEKGYRSRFPLYNIYHLLNHLNLFGKGYLSQIRSILDRY